MTHLATHWVAYFKATHLATHFSRSILYNVVQFINFSSFVSAESSSVQILIKFTFVQESSVQFSYFQGRVRPSRYRILRNPMTFLSQHSDWLKILFINQSNALSLQFVTGIRWKLSHWPAQSWLRDFSGQLISQIGKLLWRKCLISCTSGENI